MPHAHIGAEMSADGVLTIELRRPERLNAMTRAMYAAVADAIRDGASDPNARAVLFRGQGEAFCSGQDTDQINRDKDLETAELDACLRAIIDCPKPLVAAIHGHAMGFGASLITHCDVVVSTPDCKLRYPFTKLGICPAFGTSHTLVQTLGRQRAAQVLLLGEGLSGAQLHAWGLITHLEDSADGVFETARLLASKLARRRAASVEATRALILRSWGSPSHLHATGDAELFRFNRLLTSRGESTQARDRADAQEPDLFRDTLDSLYDEAKRVRQASEPDQRVWCDQLFMTLNQRRVALSKSDWRAFCAELQRHPLGAVLRDGDPLTKRAHDKPRGYAGDAVLLDMMYGIEPIEAPGWPALSRATLESDASGALKARAQMMAERMDALAGDAGTLDALSIAGGHCREVERSSAFARSQVKVTTLDLDPESIAAVRRAKPNITAVRCNILRDFVAQQSVAPSSFDFAWALGIYDYLNAARAKALTEAVWKTLRPGATYMIANDTPRCASVGYGEAVMAWYLHLREARDMIAVLDGIPPEQIAEARVTTCLDNSAMLVLEVRKAHT